jgi:hypothetical protein
MSEPGLENLWKEYKAPFASMDDLTLARWLCQTLGQFEGRLAADEARERQIWLKRLADPPSTFPLASCCRAPLLPYFSRDITNTGLICHHCSETAVPFSDVPADVQNSISNWAEEYSKIHAVAHWDEDDQDQVEDYEETLEQAAASAERLLRVAATRILPRLLEFYPVVIWQDQDECLEVQPEDIQLP